MRESQPSGPCLRMADHIWHTYEDTPTLRRLRCIRGNCRAVTAYPKFTTRSSTPPKDAILTFDRLNEVLDLVVDREPQPGCSLRDWLRGKWGPS